jgi:cytochrome b6-f complex iron-sulfur subunit
MSDASDRPTEARPSRRRFLIGVWIGLGVVALGQLFAIVFSFLRPGRKRMIRQPVGQVLVAGPVERFEAGTVTAFREGKFYLVRLDDGGFLALNRRCTHLGCTVPWVAEQGRFACPCHASAFDVRGEVLSPPAPRPLDLFPVRIENGIVKVDTTVPVKRATFDPSQVVRV